MLEEKLKDLIIEKYGSVRQFAFKIDIPYTTVDSILKRGIDNSNVGNVIKMCKALGISIDCLLDEKKISLNSTKSELEKISNNYIDNDIDALLSAYNKLPDIDKKWVKNMVIERRNLIDEQLENNKG